MTAPLDHDVRGPEDAPVLLLGASLGSTRAMWDAQVGPLAEHLRVVRYDHLGHGGSPRPPGPYTIAMLADAVVGLLDHLGVERAHVAGVSLGGMVGMQIAATRADRVDRLGLVCTSAHMPPARAWTDRAGAVRAGGQQAVVDAVVARWFTPAFADSEQAKRLRDAFLGIPPEGYASCCEAVGAMDLRPWLERIAAPTLVVAGAEDPSAPPAHSEAIAAGIGPNAELVVVPGAHLAAVEHAEAVTALLLRHFAAPRPVG